MIDHPLPPLLPPPVPRQERVAGTPCSWDQTMANCFSTHDLEFRDWLTSLARAVCRIHAQNWAIVLVTSFWASSGSVHAPGGKMSTLTIFIVTVSELTFSLTCSTVSGLSALTCVATLSKLTGSLHFSLLCSTVSGLTVSLTCYARSNCVQTNSFSYLCRILKCFSYPRSNSVQTNGFSYLCRILKMLSFSI